MQKQWVIKGWKFFRRLIQLSNKIGEASPVEASLLYRRYKISEDILYSVFCSKNNKTEIAGTYYYNMQYNKKKYYFKIKCLPECNSSIIIWQMEPWLGDLN